MVRNYIIIQTNKPPVLSFRASLWVISPCGVFKIIKELKVRVLSILKDFKLKLSEGFFWKNLIFFKTLLSLDQFGKTLILSLDKYKYFLIKFNLINKFRVGLIWLVNLISKNSFLLEMLILRWLIKKLLP